MKQPAVYLMASQCNGTLYVGVTSDLIKRDWQHRTHAVKGFAEKYNVTLLVWFEQHETMESAIAREKAIKKWNRAWKLKLIEQTNPDWLDLWVVITGEQADFRISDTAHHSSTSSHHSHAPPRHSHAPPRHSRAPSRHSRVGGNPETAAAFSQTQSALSPQHLDSRLRGNDDAEDGA